jgi:hypothetical protein
MKDFLEGLPWWGWIILGALVSPIGVVGCVLIAHLEEDEKEKEEERSMANLR